MWETWMCGLLLICGPAIWNGTPCRHFLSTFWHLPRTPKLFAKLVSETYITIPLNKNSKHKHWKRLTDVGSYPGRSYFLISSQIQVCISPYCWRIISVVSHQTTLAFWLLWFCSVHNATFLNTYPCNAIAGLQMTGPIPQTISYFKL